GFSVSGAGDINGDGIDDLIIGAPFAQRNGENNWGESYVVFGSSGTFGASLNLSTLNGSNGFVIKGINRVGTSGFSVSGAGDINGDGIDDLIIGAPGTDSNGQFGTGSSYVVFGRSSDFGASFDLSSLDGSNGFVINGIDTFDFSGGSVSSAGDINGDGFDDLIIGAAVGDPNGQDNAGESYVVFGSSSGFGASLNLSTLNGSNGFVIHGIDAGDYSGRSVSSAGDINGDGFDDLIIGAISRVGYGFSSSQSLAGKSYVVFGFATAATTNEDTAVNILASNILRRYTDIDGDTLTIDDFTNPTNGKLTFNDNGTSDNPSDDFFTYTPNANFNGTDSFNFTVSDRNGGSITSTFNLNVKPVNDAPVAVNDRFTTSFNTAVSIQASTLLANDTDIDSSNLSITGVSGATKGLAVLNDNGTQDNSADDFIVFTPTNEFSGNAKFNYTISDGSLTSTASVVIAVGANITGTNGKDTISGTPGDDKICGGNGNDTICGGKGNDTISGGNGKDIIYGGKGKDMLTGGNGNDTIFGGKGNDILTGGNGKDKFIFASKEGADTITDFRKGTDLIGLSGGLTFGQLSFRGNNILVTSTPEILATLTGIKTTTLTICDFIIV
ncbi:tandem-95 repeat protein, partial [Halotia wernerae UHCC 0503]|nr:tandem-95 repeat protein [Halotia wernerae UHCC 0503]